MGWREKMGPAKFRGVPFKVDTAERTGGRRGVTHEYPFRDEPFREDTGRKAHGFSIEGYVLGAEYLAAKEALLQALEEGGPGELVHPYYGARRVAVDTYRVRESSKDGGMATFSIEFVETPAQPAQPTATPDAAAQLRTSAASAREAVRTEFLSRFSPGTLMASAVAALRSTTMAADSAVARVAMGTQERALMRARVDRMLASATALVAAPADAYAGLADLFGGFGAGSRPALLSAYRFSPGNRPPATTANRRQEQANFDALQRLVQRLVVLRAAELALEETFDSYEAAVSVRAELTDLLDEQAETATDDTFPALLQLRADLVKAVPDADSNLPRLVTYTPPATVPSLVLAHRLYGDVALEADLLARNRVAQPGLVPGGKPLQVLSRG